MTDTPKHPLKKWLPLGLIGLCLCAFFVLGGPDYVNIDTLKTHRAFLAEFVTDHLFLTILAFVTIYTGLTAISFPGAGFLSIFGGFLFGTFLGGALNVIGASLGATLLFLAARSAIGDSLTRKAGPYMQKFEKGLKDNELSYLFILRLIPAFPFFIVNIVPALFGVKLRNYVLSTFFGIIPGALVYASIGDGIGAVFDAGEDVQLSGLMTQPRILAPIIGLIILSLIPVIYKKFKSAKSAEGSI